MRQISLYISIGMASIEFKMKKSTLSFALLLAACVLSAGEPVDLSKIDHFCPKGRVQDKDYNRHLPVIDALLEQGTNCIPLLIGMLTNQVEIDHQIVDYWPLITLGDAAFIILTDLTTDSSWKKSTIPGASWDEILGSKADTNILIPVYCQLQDFKDEHGSKEIQRRWQKIWQEHQEQIYWDAMDRCFKLRNRKSAANHAVHRIVGIAPRLTIGHHWPGEAALSVGRK